MPAAFTVYEAMRRQRVEGIAKMASRPNSIKAPGPIGRALMPILMPIFLKLAMNREKHLGPVQRYRIDWAASAR